MKSLLRHVGVFCVGLAISILIARFFVPYSYDPRNVMLIFVVCFFVYFGISIYIENSKGPEK